MEMGEVDADADGGYLEAAGDYDDGLDDIDFGGGGGGMGAEHASGGEVMLVLADFGAEDAKEMSVAKHALLRFSHRPPEAPDWAMCARLHGSGEGLVPASYLRGADGVMLADFDAVDAGEASARSGMRVWQTEPTPSSAAGWSLVLLQSLEPSKASHGPCTSLALTLHEPCADVARASR